MKPLTQEQFEYITGKLQEEATDLNGKIKRASDFIAKRSNEISEDHLHLLQGQIRAMTEYHSFLIARIDNLTTDHRKHTTTTRS